MRSHLDADAPKPGRPPRLVAHIQTPEGLKKI